MKRLYIISALILMFVVFTGLTTSFYTNCFTDFSFIDSMNAHEVLIYCLPLSAPFWLPFWLIGGYLVDLEEKA